MTNTVETQLNKNERADTFNRAMQTPQVALTFAGEPRLFPGIEEPAGNGETRYMPVHLAKAIARDEADVFVNLDREVR